MSHVSVSILAFSINFCPIKTDLSGSTVWVIVNRFARNGEWDFFCDFQTPCNFAKFRSLKTNIWILETTIQISLCSINEGVTVEQKCRWSESSAPRSFLNEGIYLLKVQCMSNGKSEATTMGSNSQAEPFTAGGPYDSSIFIMEHSTLLQEISPLFSPFRYRMTGQVLAIFCDMRSPRFWTINDWIFLYYKPTTVFKNHLKMSHFHKWSNRGAKHRVSQIIEKWDILKEFSPLCRVSEETVYSNWS